MIDGKRASLQMPSNSSLKYFPQGVHTLNLTEKMLPFRAFQMKGIPALHGSSSHCVSNIQVESPSSKIYDLEIHKNLGKK